jgi:hypothetical protein
VVGEGDSAVVLPAPLWEALLGVAARAEVERFSELEFALSRVSPLAEASSSAIGAHLCGTVAAQRRTYKSLIA